MPVRIENNGPVRTVIHSRTAARNAMDPERYVETVTAIGTPDASIVGE